MSRSKRPTADDNTAAVDFDSSSNPDVDESHNRDLRDQG
jgi:hypothetical protein